MNTFIKPPCKPDCKDKAHGCRLTCVAYLVYQIGRNMETEKAFDEKNGRNIGSYQFDKYWKCKAIWMRKKR